MAISLNDAARFSQVSYLDGGPLPVYDPLDVTTHWAQDWVQIPVDIGQPSGEYPSGYDGFAYAKVENNVVTEVVIAHRGTEFSAPTEGADIAQDIQAVILGVDGQQIPDALEFKGLAYDAIINRAGVEGWTLQQQPVEISTHVGHSLGDYISKKVAFTENSDGVAIGFDGPQTGITQAELDLSGASFTTVNTLPNAFNTAGAGAPAGDVYQISSIGDSQATGNLAAFLLQVKNNLTDVIDQGGPTNYLIAQALADTKFIDSSKTSEIPSSSVQGYSAFTFEQHDLNTIVDNLANAQLLTDASIYDMSVVDGYARYYLGDYAIDPSHPVGGVLSTLEITAEPALVAIASVAVTLLNLGVLDKNEPLVEGYFDWKIGFDINTGTVTASNPAVTSNRDDAEAIKNYIIDAFDEVANFGSDLVVEITDAVGTTIEDFGEVIDDVYEAASNLYIGATLGQRTGDPVVLDLDNDGIELTNALTAPVPFDLTDDGVLDDVAWVAPDDGLLIRDRNANGTVDGISELYGDRLTLGFDVLKAEDIAEGNGDGLITAADSFWNDLYVWRDLDQDGVSDAGELTSLTTMNITELDLRDSSIEQANQWVAGNRIIETTTFTMNGQQQELAEALFQFQSDDVHDKRGYEGGGDASLLDLPQTVGYGRLVSLQDAMALDTTLKQLVEDFNTSTDYSTLSAQVEDIMLQWAGVAAVDPASRGGVFDARYLEFMEEIYNEDYFFNIVFQAPDPNPTDARAVEQLAQSWNQLVDLFTTRLAVQGPLQGAFPNADYSFATDTVTLGSTLSEIMANVAQQPYANSIGALLDIRDIMLAYPDGLSATTAQINQSVADQIAIGLGDPDLATNLVAAFDSGRSITSVIDTHWEITGSNHLTHLGTSKSDVVLGTDQQDYIAGGEGADLLLGNGGNDVFLPGTNDYVRNGQHQNGWSIGDSLFGGAGDDLFYVDVEEALVLGEEGNDTIGLAGSRAYVIDSYVDLGDGDDYFYNVNATNSTLLGGAGDDLFQYGDITNSSLDLGDGEDRYWGTTSSNSSVYGGAGGDDIRNATFAYGDEGNDVLDGNYISYGGAGDDIFHITGAVAFLDDGNDTAYLEGSGDVVVTYNPGTHDTVVINGYWASRAIDLQGFSHIDGFEDLIITDDVNGNALIDLGENQFVTLEGVSKSQVDLRTFSGYANQGTFSGTENSELIHGSSGGYGALEYNGSDVYHLSSGNERLFGLGGDDTIYGHEGDDYIDGGVGDDVIYGQKNGVSGGFNGDDGNNTLIGGLGNDVIVSYSLGYDIIKITEEANAVDTIVASVGTDTIDLTDFDTLTPGDLVFGYENITGYIEYVELGNGQRIESGNIGVAHTFAFKDGVTQGGIASDILRGTASADTMNGANGNDVLYGLLGNDTIIGGYGNDLIYGDVDETSAGGGNDSIVGGVDKDTIYGGGGDDVIYGDELNSTYVSDDTLYGGAGNDTLFGGRGKDYIEGGDGNDEIGLSYSQDTILGGDGNDLITGVGYAKYDSFRDTVYGDAGDDTINASTGFVDAHGGDGNDSIIGGLSNDILRGDDGNDTLQAGTGANSTLEGGNGADSLVGSAARDLLYGGSDNDVIEGNGGNDVVWGGTGNDSLAGGDGNDRILGEDGNDTIDGGAGIDTITGDNNDDSVSGGAGDDVVYGDAGNDTIVAGNGNDVVWGGSGNDTFEIESGFSSTVDINDFVIGEDVIDLSAFGFAFSEISSGISASGSDALINIDGSQSLRLLGVDHTLITESSLTGLVTDQLISGGAGDDTLIADGGNDTLTGGAGNDTFEITQSANSTVTITDFDFVNGRERIDLSAFNMTLSAVVAATTVNADGHAQINLGDGQMLIVENVKAPDALNHFMFSGLTDTPTPYTESDNIILTYASDDVVDGEDGNDIIASQDGDDLVFGAEGDDQLLGGNDEDTLIGGVGADTLNGGAGNDVLFGGDGNDDIDDRTGNDLIYAGAGDDEVTTGPDTDGAADTVYGGAGNDTILTGSGADSVFGEGGDDYISVTYGYDLVHGGDGNDTIYGDLGTASSSDGDDTMYGGLGDDLLYGFGQSDLIYGGNNDANNTLDGNDTIYGRDGDDELHGEAGADWLQGDDGDDKLYGGLGDDLFYFYGANSGNDTIYGFDGAGVALGDVIRIRSDAGATQFSDLVINPDALHNGVKIDIGASGNSIVVADFQDTLTSSDFFFG